jgi:hypothetical protein
MNSTYEDIKRTLVDIGSSESYIGKALQEFGYDQFPEEGLDDEGQNRLIRRVLELATTESKLIPTINSDRKSIERIFAKASRLNEGLVSKCDRGNIERERIQDGANQFIKKALGHFKKETIKTSNEMGKLLYQTGMSLSVEEGKRIAPSLDWLRLDYGLSITLSNKVLCIDLLRDRNEEKYRIRVVKESSGVC